MWVLSFSFSLVPDSEIQKCCCLGWKPNSALAKENKARKWGHWPMSSEVTVDSQVQVLKRYCSAYFPSSLSFILLQMIFIPRYHTATSSPCWCYGSRGETVSVPVSLWTPGRVLLAPLYTSSHQPHLFKLEVAFRGTSWSNHVNAQWGRGK